jgi:riboflavin kinase / FMN adenylyltransferase
MNVVRLDSLRPLGWRAPAVTVGNFDGVHRGHQALVAEATRAARSQGGVAVALTFDPHPSHVLSPHRAPDALMTIDQKAEVLAPLGVDHLAVLPFTLALAEKSAAAFAREVLLSALAARCVVVGSSFRFGRHREGDKATLARLGDEIGFTVKAVEPVLHEGAPISSTRIREALARGATDHAKDLLGRRFFLDGTVVEGRRRGRTIGFPTANLQPENETVPGGGVYACWCRVLDGEAASPLRPAVVNIGRRPTFGGGGEVVIEAHLFDFSGDLYGRRLRLEFEERLRDERTFPDVGALKAQIEADAVQARTRLALP